ncbi:MAG: hypothetical protein RLZZ555_851 [Pseudomonadota bacterium]|jgi:signal transduction histidine kinase
MNLHPATKLLILLCLSLVLMVPLLAWFAIIRQNYDRSAKWWYSGLAVSGVGILLVAILQRASAYTAWLMVLAIIMCIHAVQLDLGRRFPGGRVVGLAYAVFLGVTWAIELAGDWLTMGAALFLSVLLVAESYLLHLLLEVRRIHRSGGLLIAITGLGPIMLVNAVRLVHAISQGAADPIFSLTLMTNAAIVGTTLSEVLMTMGYAVFTLEKSYQRHLRDKEQLARAGEQARLADTHARELQSIIGQRDAMIMLNSRFSAVNSLAIYNSAIVHELSQPLQSVQTIVDKLGIKAEHYAPMLSSDISAVTQKIEQVSAVLTSLRRLISSQAPTQELMRLDQVLGEIAPIMRSEASRRGINLDYRYPVDLGSLQIQVNRVLFERVMFNIVTNALEAFASSGISQPQVCIEVDTGQMQKCPFVVIRVEDNGPGFPTEVLAAERMPLVTSKVGGSGIGLALAGIIVESWRGTLRLSNGSAQGRTGARVELTLPTH